MMGPLFQAEHLDLASMLQKVPVQANRAIRKKVNDFECASHILRIFHNMCFSLKVLNFCGASLELHFTTATLALPRPNHMSLVCDGNQILGYISDRLWSGIADNHGG